MVEVEFGSEQEAASFWPPAWFGRELTGDPAWANQNLAVAGRPEKVLEYRLRPGEEPGSGICRVITARSSQAAAAVRAAGRSADPADRVHEARKSLKKVRSALRLLRGVIDDEERRAASDTCREAARRLSGARDAEVKMTTLELIAGDETGTTGPREAADWRKALEREAASHRGELGPENLDDVAKQIESVARTFRGRSLPEAGATVAGNVGRSYRRGKQAMRKSRKRGSPEDFHRWRKRAKDLRYQLEILEPRLPAKFRKTRKQAEELADLLGDLHDFDLLAEDLAQRDLVEQDRLELEHLVFRKRQKQAGRCIEKGKKTYRRKTKSFNDRLRRDLGPAGGTR